MESKEEEEIAWRWKRRRNGGTASCEKDKGGKEEEKKGHEKGKYTGVRKK